MKKYLPTLLLLLVGCSDQQPARENFTSEINQLRDYFHIPGISVIVTQRGNTLYENYIGFADLENQVPMDSTTVIPMASLTKMFTGRLMRDLDPRVLEQPVNNYISSDNTIADSIKVKHVLSHTSQGDVGKHFYYSNRFSWLTKVIGDQDHISFHDLIRDSIVGRYSLRHTFLLEDSTSIKGKKVAKPYVFEGETKPGFIDYGYSSAAGIVSTVRDLAKFSDALDDTPDFREQYNYGLFKQVIKGETILWAYGQYDCYSSLFIKVPGKGLTCVIAANNNLMSDPARLIYGDVTTSLFALSFFENFMDMDLTSEELRAEAVAESYLGIYDLKRAGKSKELLREYFRKDSSSNSLTTMHNISILKMIAAQNNLPAFTEFDPQLKRMGNNLLAIDINNPYANIYMAECYDFSNNIDSARVFYKRIAEAKNFARNWYTNEADQRLKEP